jgi:chromosomal replication initiation ATPase DnaA
MNTDTINTLHSIRRTVNDLSVKIDELIRQYNAEDKEDRGYRPKIIAIQKAVANHYDLPIQAMTHKKRTKDWAAARQVAMYFARMLTKYSLEDIGRCFGNRDHGTIAYAVEQTTNRLDIDKMFAADMINIEAAAKIALENLELPLFEIKKP